jgi:hypothetical protein
MNIDTHIIFNVIAAMLLFGAAKWTVWFIFVRLALNGILGIDTKRMAVKKFKEAIEKAEADGRFEPLKSFSERIDEMQKERKG